MLVGLGFLSFFFFPLCHGQLLISLSRILIVRAIFVTKSTLTALEDQISEVFFTHFDEAQGLRPLREKRSKILKLRVSITEHKKFGRSRTYSSTKANQINALITKQKTLVMQWNLF